MSAWPPTWDQVKGIAERLITLGLTSLFSWAVVKGWISKEDAVKYGTEYGPIVLTLVAAAYGAWVNRPKAIVQSAAALPNTVVVTAPDLAHSTPEPNIVSAATNSVEPLPAGAIKSASDLNREEFARLNPS